jgi:hypothetical protein
MHEKGLFEMEANTRMMCHISKKLLADILRQSLNKKNRSKRRNFICLEFLERLE